MEANRDTSCCSVENNKAERNFKQEIEETNKDEDKTSKTSSPKHGSPKIGIKEDDELETAKAEMGEVRQENERLKKMLERIENDYRSLQMRFFGILQPEKSTPTISDNKSLTIEETQNKEEEPEVSLSLGLQVINTNKRKKEDSSSTSNIFKEDDEKLLMSEGLSLGLEIKSIPTIELSDKGSERSNELHDDAKEDGVGETWPPNKVLKTTKEDDVKEEESSQTNGTKRARVCVRARCETPTMNDGCQWRKYGQKIAKGNPCPRAYYRCTVAPSCPVRKQVQRCSEDMSILITTYEGTHNHPLSVAATAMASTTSAAASILLSGSSTSQGGGGATLSSSAPTMTTTNLNGHNFTLYNNSRPGQFNVPTSSPTPPTITLDLTSTPSSHFNKRSSNFLQSSSNYSSRSLDFSSTESKPTFPTSWTTNNSNNNSHINYGSFPSNNRAIIGSISFGKPTYDNQPSSYLERINPVVTSSSTTTSFSSPSNASHQFLTETLTKVLTSDPSFQSAVAAAISSMVGSSSNTTNITSLKRTNSENLAQNLKWVEQFQGPTSLNRTNSENLAQNLKWVDQVQGFAASSLSQNGKGCTPNYLNKPTSSSSTFSSQPAGNFMLLQPAFPFSSSKSSSSPDHRD